MTEIEFNTEFDELNSAKFNNAFEGHYNADKNRDYVWLVKSKVNPKAMIKFGFEPDTDLISFACDQINTYMQPMHMFILKENFMSICSQLFDRLTKDGFSPKDFAIVELPEELTIFPVSLALVSSKTSIQDMTQFLNKLHKKRENNGKEKD